VSKKVKDLPDDLEYKLTFPKLRGETLFSSPQELFNTTLHLFSKMIQRMRKAKSSQRDQSFRRKKIHSNMAGRRIRLVRYNGVRNTLAPYETILHHILKKGYSQGARLQINSEDFLGWERQVQESLTLVLAVDVSRSTLGFKEMFARIIKNLSAHFKRHRDRIGLISISGYQAEILNHPSRNHRIVAKSIMQLNIQGMTPLGDGLNKSLEMVKMERTKNPGSKPVVIVLSDCFPEPLTHKYDDLFDEPLYRHAVAASECFKRQGVALIIINPSYYEMGKIQLRGAGQRKRSPGEKLTDELIQRSGGRLIKLQTRSYDTAITQKTEVIGEDRQIQDILTSIESAFTGQTRNDFGINH